MLPLVDVKVRSSGRAFFQGMEMNAQNRNQFIVVLLIAAIALLGFNAWRLHKNIQLLKVENERLLQTAEPATSKAAPEDVAIDSGQSAAAGSPAEAIPTNTPAKAPIVNMVNTLSGMAPEPKNYGLTLEETKATPIKGGIKASMKFKATTKEPLGVVTVVVRVSPDESAQILDLGVGDESKFQGVVKRVLPPGKFAIFEGRAEQLENVQIDLSVSGTAVADVRGTVGIGPFDLTIEPDQAIARPK